MGSTAIDVVALIVQRVATWFSWASTGSYGPMPL